MAAGTSLLHMLEETLRKRENHSGRRRLTLAPPGSVDFSSNDFLSLSKSEELRDSYISSFKQASQVPLGSGGSRLLDGNFAYVEELEEDISSFHNAPSGLFFNSGFDANSGMFSCIPQPKDVIVYDEYIHASVHEGMRLSRAGKCISFQHNCVTDFNRQLRDIVEADAAIRSGQRNVFIALETVYSMDGDVAPVKAILDSIDRLLPLGNGHVIIDEAHSTGVFGNRGRGIICRLGLESRILARLHTFGKALSSGGAIVLCSPVLREYLLNYARSLIYTTALGLPTLAMISAVHGLMRRGGTCEAQERLWKLIAYFHSSLSKLPITPLLQISPEPPRSPIFSVCTPHPRSLAKFCQNAGFVVRPIVPPTVPEGGQRIRVCLHAGNSMEEIDRLMQTILGWVASFSIATNGKTFEVQLQKSRL